MKNQKSKIEEKLEEKNTNQIGNVNKRPIDEMLRNSIYYLHLNDLLKITHDKELIKRIDINSREIIERISSRLKGLPYNLLELLSVDPNVAYPPRLELTLNKGYWLGTFGQCVQKVSKFEELKDDFERKYSKPIEHLTGQYKGFVPLEFRDEPPFTDVIQIDHRRESLREVDLVIVPLNAIKSYKLIEKYQRRVE